MCVSLHLLKPSGGPTAEFKTHKVQIQEFFSPLESSVLGISTPDDHLCFQKEGEKQGCGSVSRVPVWHAQCLRFHPQHCVTNQVWWCMSVILALEKVEAVGSEVEGHP